MESCRGSMFHGFVSGRFLSVTSFFGNVRYVDGQKVRGYKLVRDPISLLACQLDKDACSRRVQL